MAEFHERFTRFQSGLTPQLSSEAVVSVPTSEEFHHSNLRFTQYERPVSRAVRLGKKLTKEKQSLRKESNDTDIFVGCSPSLRGRCRQDDKICSSE